jgi:4-diphosphocytidyl-2-C-methyl-D-erythritol kinase
MSGGAARTLRVRIPAKINLHLGVGPRRPDGYHDVVTVLQTVSIFDTLRLQFEGEGQSMHPSARRRMRVLFTLEADDHSAEVPADAANLALVAAAQLMQHLGIDDDPAAPTTRMHLTKRIPVAAGMAGGSADAAAALAQPDGGGRGGVVVRPAARLLLVRKEVEAGAEPVVARL